MEMLVLTAVTERPRSRRFLRAVLPIDIRISLLGDDSSG